MPRSLYKNEPWCFLGGRLLVLSAVDVANAWRWRWLLSDEESGRPLADHVVELDPVSGEVAVFGDLYGYVGEHASPDHPDKDEVRIVARVGAWAGRELLGEAIGGAIVAEAPVTVRGEVALVYDAVPVTGGQKEPVAERPRPHSPMALRRR